MKCTLTTIHPEYGECMTETYTMYAKNDTMHSPYWIESKLRELSNCDQYKRNPDNLLSTAIFDIAVISNPNVLNETRERIIKRELSRCIVQMDSEPFQRLIGALSEIKLTEILMEIMRIRHETGPEPETVFRL